jgi:molybdopterin converting factor small subunit
MATLRIPPVLRPLVEERTTIDVAGGSLGDSLESLFASYPEVRERILEADGSLRRFVNVFVDSEDVRLGEGLATPVGDGSTIIVLPAMAGGSRV